MPHRKKTTPLEQKADEIRELAYQFVKALPDEAPNANLSDDDPDDPERMDDPTYVMRYTGEHAQMAWDDHKKWIMECSHIIPSKIAGAMGADLYDIYYEQAALVRKACRELVTNLQGLKMCGYREEQYFDLIRTAVEVEFKPLFREWAATFKDKEHIPDSWGLFNPPGVNWDDEMY